MTKLKILNDPKEWETNLHELKRKQISYLIYCFYKLTYITSKVVWRYTYVKWGCKCSRKTNNLKAVVLHLDGTKRREQGINYTKGREVVDTAFIYIEVGKFLVRIGLNCLISLFGHCAEQIYANRL